MDWITFTTDYGLADGFVATCHGVIARIAPRVRVLDVSHGVPPQDVRRGAQVLAQSAPYLPDAVHLVVVDPGVGTARRGIVVRTARGLLVGPDNGVLLAAAEALGGIEAAHELAAPEYRLPEVSATFHGRDVFAPAAAHLALGVAPERFGPPLSDLVRLPVPEVHAEPGRLVSEVLGADHFGNVQLAARATALTVLGAAGAPLSVRANGCTLPATLGRTFADVPGGGLLVHVDSAGQVALAVNGGSALATLGGQPDSVTVTVA